MRILLSRETKVNVMFKNRKDAGEKLAKALEKYRGKDVLVLAIPRGGVPVGIEVAEYLDADFSLIVCRKLPYPDNPEAGFGAVAEDGSFVVLESAGMPELEIQRIAGEQRKKVERRVQMLRGGKPLPEIEGRKVILVDDGIAMGSTMRAAVKMCRSRGAEEIIVAVPVSGKGVAEEIGKLANELVVLEKPANFRAVAQVYGHWHDVSDGEVLEMMGRHALAKRKPNCRDNC